MRAHLASRECVQARPPRRCKAVASLGPRPAGVHADALTPPFPPSLRSLPPLPPPTSPDSSAPAGVLEGTRTGSAAARTATEERAAGAGPYESNPSGAAAPAAARRSRCVRCAARASKQAKLTAAMVIAPHTASPPTLALALPSRIVFFPPSCLASRLRPSARPH